ncbi:MAG: polyprenyl synthetase family protein [Bacilli bacterium]|nr:polyprenyl synthetase family protein [Bacilli bacterium]
MENLKLLNEAIENHLQTIENEDLRAASAYSLFPGGKRLRPLMLFAALKDLDRSLEDGIYPALAIELIHTYSLIHDDLPSMDNDDFRRGKPSLHKKFNEALAILTADAFLSDAFRYFLMTPISRQQKIELIELASSATGSGGMVLGQVLDLKAGESSLEKVQQIHLHKTADLFTLAILGAGIIAGADDKTKTSLKELAINFGLAFQIKDDLEDFNKNSDLQKLTFPKVLGIYQSEIHLQKYKERSLQITRRIFGSYELYHLIERIL